MPKNAFLVIVFLLMAISMPLNYQAADSILNAAVEEPVRPVVYLESYTTSGAMSAGEDIVVTFMLRNASLHTQVHNILLNVQSSPGAFYPAPGHSSQYFVEKIPPGEGVAVDVYMAAHYSAPDNTYDIPYNITFQGGNANTPYSTSGIISLALRSELLKFISVSAPDEAIENRMLYISVRYASEAKNDLNNVIIQIEGNIETYQKKIEIGAVRASSNGISESEITFTSSGAQMLTFHLIYEDGEGNAIIADTVTTLVLVTQGPANETPAPQPAQNESRAAANPTIMDKVKDNILIILASVALICAIGIMIVKIRWKRR